MSSSDSENDKFKQDAKNYLKKHVRTILETKPATDRKSRQWFEEFKSNKIKSNQNLISQDPTEAADVEVMSINTEDAALFSRKLTKEELFKCKCK